MSIKTRKIKLIAVGETAAERTNSYKYVKKIASELVMIGNEVIRLHVCNQYTIDKLKTEKQVTKGEAKNILEKNLGMSIRNTGYRMLTKFSHIGSEIRTGFNSEIYKTISNNFGDILNGIMSIPSFRKTKLSIPFSAHNDKNTKTPNSIYKNGDRYYIDFPLSGSEIKKGVNIKFSLFFGKDRSDNKIIIDRILDGTYKMCDSEFFIKDNDIYVMVAYNQPVTITNIDPNKVMGVDLGINRPVSIYIAGESHQPQQINIGLKIQHERMKFYKHRKSLQEGVKYSKGGHGIKRKLSALQDLKDKESNWSKLINHTITREVINIALQHGVGTIRMENLTGISTNKNDYFLKSWAYYQLQSFIKYKAAEVGIKCEGVSPVNTSITCPTCNISNPLNRNNKDKTIFKCTNEFCTDFDKIKDADIVGAYNITFSLPEIDGKTKKGKILKTLKKKKQLELS